MPRQDTVPDPELLARSHLLERLYRQDHPWLLGRLYDRLRNREDAEDVAGETFSQLVASPALDGLREPRALLVTVAKRIMWKLWRRRELEQAWLDSLRAGVGAMAPSVQDQLEILQALQAVDAVLAGLPVKARRAFLYSQVDGMKHADIAAELGVSVASVRYYIAQALRRCVLVRDEA